MKKIDLSGLEKIEGGYCAIWIGPNGNASDNANPDPLPYQFCNHCLFVSAISSNPSIVYCAL